MVNMLIHPSHIDNHFSFGKKKSLVKIWLHWSEVVFCHILAKCKMSVLTQRLIDKWEGILSLLSGCMKTDYRLHYKAIWSCVSDFLCVLRGLITRPRLQLYLALNTSDEPRRMLIPSLIRVQELNFSQSLIHQPTKSL